MTQRFSQRTGRGGTLVLFRGALRALIAAALIGGCVTDEEVSASYRFQGDDGAKEGSSVRSRIEVLERKIKSLPNVIDLRVQLAQLYFQDEQYDQAIETVKAAIEKDPENGRLHYLLGDFYIYMNRYGEAEGAYRNVIKYSKPGYTGPHLALGYVLAMQEKYEEAIEQFKLVLKLQPRLATAIYYMASCYDVMGRRKKAIEFFEKCAEIESPYQQKAKAEAARLRALSKAGLLKGESSGGGGEFSPGKGESTSLSERLSGRPNPR